jgi:hypothetical protein
VDGAIVKPVSETGLVALAEAKRWLAEAREVLQVLDLRHTAALSLQYARYITQRDDAVQAALNAAEIRLRAERRLGELLAESVNHEGSRGVGISVLPTLPEGIDKLQSSRYQRAATVPAEQFEALISEARSQEDVGRLTSAAVARLAAARRGAAGDAPPARDWEACPACAGTGRIKKGSEETGGDDEGPPWRCAKPDCRWENDCDSESCIACGRRRPDA